MTRERERKLTLWVLTIGYVALIFGVSSIPGTVRFVRHFYLPDKLAHLAEYAGFALVLTAAYRAALTGWRRRLLWLFVLVTGFGVGLLDEVYQTTVPGRTLEFLDWVADAIGTTAGFGVATVLHKRRSAAPRLAAGRSP